MSVTLFANYFASKDVTEFLPFPMDEKKGGEKKNSQFPQFFLLEMWGKCPENTLAGGTPPFPPEFAPDCRDEGKESSSTSRFVFLDHEDDLRKLDEDQLR